MQAGLAKLIGLAGETNVQASVPGNNCHLSQFLVSEIEIVRTEDLLGVTRERSRRSWTCCPTRCSSRLSSAAAAPYELTLFSP